MKTGPLILGTSLAVALASCSTGADRDCSNSVIAETTSPNGEWKAITFDRFCTLVRAKSVVSVLHRTRDLVGDEGTVFRYVDTTTPPPSEVRRDSNSLRPVAVEWTADNALVITYDRRALIGRMVVISNTIPIHYRTFEYRSPE